MITLTDQLGRRLSLSAAPRRIVSLVPSITELLAEYRLDGEVVGITKFCTHPSRWFTTKPRIGGTKTIDVERIRALRPDLVIANQEENDRAAVETLMREFPVYVSRVATLADADELFDHLGKLTDREAAATQWHAEHRALLNRHRNRFGGARAAYFIWRDPYMVAGGDTYIHAVMRHLGLVNVFGDRARYPTVTLAACAALDVQRVLLSSEPFPFQAKHIAEMRTQLPDAQYALVDGRAFSWYGPGARALDELDLAAAAHLTSPET